ncbi:MAG: hypothetical protein KJO51_05635 [Gramella sp.]|nr:hypothetical protein [Christiangramia sp.]
MQKILNKSGVLIFLLLHFLFLIAAVIDNKDDLYSIFILVPVIILLVIFYLNITRTGLSGFEKNDIFLVTGSSLGALITYGLHVELPVSTVLAAGLTGLLSSFLPYLNRSSQILKVLPAAIYCGAFAGMTGPSIANGYGFICLAGIFSGIILVISQNTLNGYGGKLGTIAFGGVALMTLILFMIT